MQRRHLTASHRKAEQAEQHTHLSAMVIQRLWRAFQAREHVKMISETAYWKLKLTEIRGRLRYIRLKIELKRWVLRRRMKAKEEIVAHATAAHNYVKDFLTRLTQNTDEGDVGWSGSLNSTWSAPDYTRLMPKPPKANPSPATEATVRKFSLTRCRRFCPRLDRTLVQDVLRESKADLDLCVQRPLTAHPKPERSHLFQRRLRLSLASL